MSTEIVEIVRRRAGCYVITDSEPTIRTVRFQCDYNMANQYTNGSTANGYHRLRLPYVRMVFFLHHSNAYPHEMGYAWTKKLWTYGSLQPYENLNQRLFALPMPNTDHSGLVHCCGMSNDTAGSLEFVTTQVFESYWGSVFSYWCEFNYGFKPFQNIAMLKKIIPLCSIASHVPGINGKDEDEDDE